MGNPKDILVLTTSSVEGLKIKKPLKPVTAHVVAGTNFFSDFMGGLTDVFGGRSNSYQKQLTSIYNEAIEKIKFAAHEIGGNCIIGLSIDLDEISGKGKSMFMITAIGTAVIIEKENVINSLPNKNEKFDNVSIERIKVLRKKKELIKDAQSGTLTADEDFWNFVTENQIEEVFPYILKRYSDIIVTPQNYGEAYNTFNKRFTNYVNVLNENQKNNLLYDNIKSVENNSIAEYLSKVIEDLNLFNYEKIIKLLSDENFNVQKIALKMATYDKPFYNQNDKENLDEILENIQNAFFERGTKTMKKQMLSSKEKEVWSCECSKINEIGEYCSSCNKDILGFKPSELKPSEAENEIRQKIDLIKEYLQL
ncbi:YbjQ family protein [Flavobacterium sp. FlaQc-52]|uniref:YbjQ family protein n=1 Tax=Flavobacterium sp. FlaQc-52 TaxID=3374185 RepID=UPI0037568D46